MSNSFFSVNVTFIGFSRYLETQFFFTVKHLDPV